MVSKLDDPIYSPSESSPTCLDLFAGAGGLSLGFLMAGGRPLGAVDSDSDSIATFARNLPMALENHVGSIENWQPTGRLLDVDVVVGGPPCQGFSLARGTRFMDDPRNKLYKHFVRTVAQIRPEWVVMENVEGILSIGGGQILEQILEDFLNVGYELDYQVVNMADFGVPQTRRRAIFVGHRSGLKFVWPERTHSKSSDTQPALVDSLPQHVSVNDALSDLSLSRGNYFSHRANSQMRGPRNRDANSKPAFTLRVRGDEFALCENPAESSFIPEHRVDEPRTRCNPKNSYQELMQIVPSWAVPPIKRVARIKREAVSGSRYLTMREQARLQSFPDWFEFQGVKTSQSRQIGNAVPPLFAAQLFRSIFSSR